MYFKSAEERQQYEAWLAGLKVGDQVAIERPARHMAGSRYVITQVRHVTKTRVDVEYYQTIRSFRREDGYQTGRVGAWSVRDSLVPATPEVLDDVEKHRLIWQAKDKLETIDWEKIDLQGVRLLIDCITVPGIPYKKKVIE